jgi:hypothetical protein
VVFCLGFLATGTQWDVVQAAAWGRMMAVHAETESVSQAVADTFSGEMCSICRLVAAAHQQEQKSRAPGTLVKLESKIVLFLEPALTFQIARQPSQIVRASDPQMDSRGRAMPPVPPPRIAAV